MTEKMIPLSVIDALIAELEKKAYMSTTIEISPFEVILNTLKEIKKEAIPSPENIMKQFIITCPECKKDVSIPGKCEECDTEYGYPIETTPLEQKIKDRINSLENMWFTGPNVMRDIEYRDVKIDELRKLVIP